MKLKAKWRYGLTGAREVTQRCPIVLENTVLATFNHGQGSNFKGTLSAIDIENGKEKWCFNTRHFLNEPSLSSDGSILLTCFDGSVYRLESNGNLYWKSRPSMCNLWSGLVLGDKFIYPEIAGGAQFTRALNLNDGSVAWEYENGGHSYSLSSDLGARVVHSSVSGGFGEYRISLHCLEKDTGKVIWRIEHDQYLFEPLIVGEHVWLGSRGHVALFDLETGELLARHQIEEGVAARTKAVEVGTGAVFTNEKGRLLRLDIKEKAPVLGKKTAKLEQKWSLDLGSEVKTRAVMKGDQILVITEAGNLVSIGSETGRVSDQVKVPGFKEGHGFVPHGSDLIVSVSKDCVRLAINS